ncbi:MAG: hypothetical protein LKG15_04380 [Corynebacterium provencense]|uniref:hypothetical protein n=1 Tax=Corynebacterium provencense TaxID=1737425 RepID=UPI002989B00E|nr:hypothetical protein [Corynebacterium provencense]
MKTRFIPLLLAVTTTAALVACSDDTSGTTAGTSGSSGAASGADSASFPVTFTSPFGTTTVESRPQRVVALGWSDQAVATELGADVVMAPQTYSVSAAADPAPTEATVRTAPPKTACCPTCTRTRNRSGSTP